VNAALPRERARDGAIALSTLGGVALAAALAGRSSLDAAARETLAAWPGMAILAILTVGLFGLVEVIDRTRRVDREWSRKLGHVGAGAIALLAPALLPSHWPMLVLTAGFAAILLLARPVKVLAPFHPEGRRGAGDLTYPAGLYAAFVMAASHPPAYQIGVLILALADPAATVAGRLLRGGRFAFFGTPRSLAGSAAFAAVAAIAATVVLVVSGGAIGPSVARAIAIAAIAAAVEAVSPSGLDNLTVPVAAVGVALVVGA